MVLFFTASEDYVIYMGKDKYENEDLIKYGIPEDIWFHVDDMSSAHVYLRLRKDQRLENVTDEVIICLLYTSPSPRDRTRSRMPSSA